MIFEDTLRKFMSYSWWVRVVLVSRWFLIILLWPLNALFLFLACIAKPIVRIKVGSLYYDRIGHLALNTELFLRRQIMQREHKAEFVVFVSGPPANKQLLKMIRRRVPVIKSNVAITLYWMLRRGMPWSPVWFDLTMNSNEHYEFAHLLPQLLFTQEEEKQGQFLLASMGIATGDSFVGFFNRDFTYLKQMFPNEDFSYHDYRDCSIQNYLSAVELLVDTGLWALRMGHLVQEPVIPTKNGIIDYATNFRTDFGDVYLISKSKFILGCAGGINALAYIFNIPGAYANMIPLKYIALGKDNLFIYKKLWDTQSKKFIKFRQALESGIGDFHTTREYVAAGIEVIENTPEEIMALAVEMNTRLDGTWISHDEDEELQNRFRAIYISHHSGSGFASRVGTVFLRRNRELLD